MLLNVEFHKVAFRHHVTEANIRHALWHPIYEKVLDVYKDKWLLIGYDTVGNLIEIVYNRIGDDTAYVFHAMPCRPKFFDELYL
jgi:hypothetical protein